MINIKYSVTFRLLSKAHPDGSHTVRMTVCWKGQRVSQCLPVSAFEDQWDDFSMRARPTKTHREINNINEVVFSFRDKVTDIFQTASLNNHVPSKEELTNALATKIEKPEEEIVEDTETAEVEAEKEKTEENAEVHPIAKTITEFILNQSEERGWAPITAKKFYNIQQDILNAGLKNVEDLNGEGVKKLMKYLNTRNLENAVLMKKASVLRWFLGWCRRVGYLDNDEYKLHQPHLKCPQKEVIYLTWDELLQLYYFDYGSHIALDQARDVFCFCCFTGLRYSDAKRLKWSDVHADHIRIVTQKTSDSLTIELNKYSRSIIDKYRTNGVFSPDQLVLPAISIQKNNEHIKDCAMLAQIDETLRLVSYKGHQRIEKSVLKWEVITTHCARRTFVVNALRLGIPAEVIMKWTGHSDFKAMKPYVAIVDELKRENMALFDKA